jgi:hypothetical protein
MVRITSRLRLRRGEPMQYNPGKEVKSAKNYYCGEDDVAGEDRYTCIKMFSNGRPILGEKVLP